MLMIRLQRIGRKKSPSYRLVLAEKARDTQGRATEILGTYNPILKEKPLDVKKDRIEYWLSQGAQTSATVNNLLLKEGIVKGDKAKSVSISKKRHAKLNEKNAAAEEAKKAAKEAEAAKKAEEAAPKATEEKDPSADLPTGQAGAQDKEEKKEEAPAEPVAEEKKEEAPADASKEAPQDEEKKDA